MLTLKEISGIEASMEDWAIAPFSLPLEILITVTNKKYLV